MISKAVRKPKNRVSYQGFLSFLFFKLSSDVINTKSKQDGES